MSVSIKTQTPSQKVKVLIIGRGEPTSRQIALLKKALGGREIEIVGRIEQLNNIHQLKRIMQETGAEVIFSFIVHPTVINILQQFRKMVGVDYYAPRTEAVLTKNVSTLEEAKQLCWQNNADIINNKVLPNGEVSVRCTKTVALMKNPKIRIEAEEEIQ